MNKYPMVKLGDVCEKASSNIAQKDIINNCGNYPIYGASGLIKEVDFYKQERPYIAIVKDGAGVGRVMALPKQSSIIGTMQYILPCNNIDISYLYYALISLNLSKYSTGATIPHIYFKNYSQEKIPLPPLEEQRHIAEVLDKVTAQIDTCNKLIDNLDLLVKSKFVEMFGNGKYEIVKASEVCDFITKGTTPPAEEILEKYSDDTVPYLKVYNLSFTGKMLFDANPQYIPNLTHNGKLSRSKVYPNDVLMNIVGPPLGKFALVTDEYSEWNINQAIAIFRAKERILPRFLLYALMQPDVLKPFINQAVGIRQQNLSLEQCRNLEIPLPPMELQNQFADFVESVEHQKTTALATLNRLETLKNALMQQFFYGNSI